MEQELLKSQKAVSQYEAEMNNNIMKLNNEIAQKKLHHEELMVQLNKMKLDNQDAGHR